MPALARRCALRPASFLTLTVLWALLLPSGALAAPVIDTVVYADGSGWRTTPAFSTSTSGELLVAFVGADGPAGTQTTTVSGAGLTWTLVQRANAQYGSAEIWKAWAASRLSNVTVTSRIANSGYYQSLTVVAFTGASSIGASTKRSASSGAPSASLTTTQSNSWVFGVGVDWDRAISRTLGSNQTMVHQYLATTPGATAWTQRMSSVTATAGTNVTINDTAPTTDRWNLSLCEILSAASDTTPPTITSVSPAAGSTAVAATAKVTATFSEGMTASSITASTFLLQAGATTVSATLSYSASTHVATLTPSSALASLTTYTATVKGGASGVKDSAGNALLSDYQWSFTTADTTPPTITSVSPPSGTAGVSPATTVSATFSEAMNASTITASTFVLQTGTTSVAATVAYNATTRTATLTPNAPLTGGASYSATVKGGSTGVKDAAGNALASNAQWSFSVADTTPPTITAVTPPSGASGVSAGTAVTATFSEALNAATISAATFFLQTSGAAVPATLSYNSASHVATLTPSATLAGLTSYTATVKGAPGGVTDTAGNQLAADVVWTFTTADTTPPTITSTTPADGATGVAATSTVTATFSKAMNASTITGSTFTLKAGATSVAATLAYDTASQTATLTPAGPLPGGATYTATVKGGSRGVKDTVGNALAADVQWSFTVPDTTPPVITSVTPGDGATGVPVGTTVTAAFNEAIDPATLTSSSFSLQSGGTSVAATVAYDAATNAATLTPSSALDVATTYTATIAGGASGVTDVAGNPLASDYVWSFVTPVPDTTAPTTTSTSPSGTTVPVTTTVTATFSESLDPSTVTGATFVLQAPDSTIVAATVAYNDSTLTATLTPGAPLAMATAYSVTIKGAAGGVADLAGNPLAADVVWSFTTATDSIAPTLTFKTPAAGATGIPASVAITGAFSEALDLSSITASTVALKQTSTGTLIAAHVSYNAVTNVVTLVPSTALAYSTNYTASVQGGVGGVTDLAGNPLAASVVWSFTTGSQPTSAGQVTVNSASVRQTMDGIGGDYAYAYDDALSQFTLSNLRPAHGRFQMYLPEWEPANDNFDSQTFNWPAFQDVGWTHLNFLLMQQFQQRGIPMVISVWDAPNWMVSNPGNTSQRNIPQSMWGEAIESMAAYLVYARDQYGVTVDYMSINEADGGYNLIFSTSNLNSFVKQATARFAALGLPTKWLAGDAANANGVVSYASPLLADSTTRPFLGPVSVHTWNPDSTSDSTLTSIYNLAAQYNRHVWVEELGIDPSGWNNPSYTTTWSYAFSIANLYRRMLGVLRASLIDYWEYSDDYPLVNINNFAPYPVYYAIKPLADYLLPGTQMVDVTSNNSNVVAVAGKNDGRQTSIVYAINNATFAQTITFTGLPSTVMTMLRTTSTESMVTVGSYNPQSGTLTLTLPAQSVNALVAGDPISAFPEVIQ